MRLATFAAYLLITALEAVGLVTMMAIIRTVVEWQCDDETFDEKTKEKCRDSQFSKDIILIVVFWAIFVVHVVQCYILFKWWQESEQNKVKQDRVEILENSKTST